MLAKLKVRRFNPESGGDSYFQSFEIEAPDYATVLDSLLLIREEVDGSLALRCSCRSAICGSCAMRVDGQARLACKTKVRDLAPEGQEVQVEPMGNMPVVKDLVTDMQPFWDKVQAVTPWLQPSGPEPEHEHIVPNEAMLDVAGAMNCIMCGACVSDCTVLEVDQRFLGPAALAKAYRFVGDPRDSADGDRFNVLSEYGGVWDCTRCNYCVEVCPKGVAPMERILNLRRKVIDAGQVDTLGARHTIEFEETTRQRSWLAQM